MALVEAEKHWKANFAMTKQLIGKQKSEPTYEHLFSPVGDFALPMSATIEKSALNRYFVTLGEPV